MKLKTPLPLLLHSLFNEMQFDSAKNSLTNISNILSKISDNQNFDASLRDAITLKEHFYYSHEETINSVQFGTANICLRDIISAFGEEDNLGFLQKSFFPQLSKSTLWSVLFNIQHIIDSLRLDISTKIKPDNWYYQKSSNPKYMISKPYFYYAVLDYIKDGQKANLLFNLLHATSRSPLGGLESVSYFDIISIDNKYEIVIPNSQFTYADVLTALSSPASIDKLYHYYKQRIGKKKLLGAVRFTRNLWKDLLEISNDYEPLTSCFTKETLISDKTYSDCKWNDPQKFTTYENCIFINIDFSYQIIQSDFIFCTFKECNFTSTQLEDFYENNHFPIIQCKFIACSNIPKDFTFQERIKNCTFTYKFTL
jgi:hypothetical protein